MAERNTFRKCEHTIVPIPIEVQLDWRDCPQCVNEVVTQLTIARSYLRELSHADFNINGDCVKPVSEPVQGRHFTQIAATGLGACSDF